MFEIVVNSNLLRLAMIHSKVVVWDQLRARYLAASEQSQLASTSDRQ